METPNKFHQICEWIMRFSVANFMWVVSISPLVLMVVFAVMADQQAVWVVTFAAAVTAGPFLFFPATAALFASVRDFIIKEADIHPVKDYFRHFRNNYRQAMLAGFILTALWAVWAVDYYYLMTFDHFLLVTFAFFGIPLYLFSVYVLMVMSHFHTSMKDIYRRAFYFTFGAPLTSLLILSLTLMLIFISLSGWMFLLVIFGGSMIAFISFSTFYKKILKLQQQHA